MNILTFDPRWITPAVAVFLSLAVGILFGRIRFGKFTLGLSGILFAAVFTGAMLRLLQNGEGAILLTGNMQEIFPKLGFLAGLGSAVFLSSVGISSGETLYERRGTGRTWFSFLMGTVPVAVCFLTATLLRIIDRDTPTELLGGLLTGAMTSTPGLTALCESVPDGAGYAAIGYSSSYLIGITGILLFTQLLDRRISSGTPAPGHSAVPGSNPIRLSERGTGILVFLTAVFGSALGNLTLFSSFPLGNSGGILIAGMGIGYLIARRTNLCCDKETLLKLRKTGLAVFFVGTGIPAGGQFTDSWNPKYLGYGALLTLVPITVGYLLYRLFRIPRGRALRLLCGGLTSTPAIGVLTGKEGSRADLSDFAIAYIGALLAMMAGIRLWI